MEQAQQIGYPILLKARAGGGGRGIRRVDSADELEKLEYEAREKAIRDHNSQMGSALRRGFKQGIQRGIEQGIQQGIQRGIEEERASLIRNMLKNGVTPESISKMTGISLEAIEAVRQKNSSE